MKTDLQAPRMSGRLKGVMLGLSLIMTLPLTSVMAQSNAQPGAPSAGQSNAAPAASTGSASSVPGTPSAPGNVAPRAMPPKPYTGFDFSGVYDCAGQDSQEGDYTGVVTLELVRSQSTGAYGAYRFKLEVPGYGEYPGHAAAHRMSMGIFFANTDPATKDYGTGVAHFARNKSGKWTFRKYYYEPEFKAGNFGFELCKQR